MFPVEAAGHDRFDPYTPMITTWNLTEDGEAGKTVTIFNDFVEKESIDDYGIDYAYYINHVQKVINEIINPQLSLWDSN
jgi:hypothetical protein